VLGTDERLFRETSDKHPCGSLTPQTVGCDLAYLIYQAIRDA
jgi:hypothetical protein